MECGILPPARMGVASGCPLEINHAGQHRSVTEQHGEIAWQTSPDCNCDDCHSDDPDDWCVDWEPRDVEQE